MRLLASLLLAINAWAIVDIAPVEIGDKVGVSGNIAASYASKSGNTEKEEYNFSGKLQYDSNESYLFFVQASYERAESFDVKTEDQTYSHARYLHKLGREDLYGEIFFQYRENIFKGIDTRYLLGGNLRWRVVNKADFGKLYIGLGAFHEEMDPLLLRLHSAGNGVVPRPILSTRNCRNGSFAAGSMILSAGSPVSL